MVQIRKLQVPGYEKLIEGKDEASGLLCYIAIHNTKLGPALGGCRIYPYETVEQAIEDSLRLAEGMTYKSALAKMGFGGGKSVIVADPYTQKTPQLLMAFAEVVNSLQGEYITAEDVGTTTADIEIMHQKTPHVVGLPFFHGGGSGDPSPFTAW
jgi:leucine dehydrogenase